MFKLVKRTGMEKENKITEFKDMEITTIGKIKGNKAKYMMRGWYNIEVKAEVIFSHVIRADNKEEAIKKVLEIIKRDYFEKEFI